MQTKDNLVKFTYKLNTLTALQFKFKSLMIISEVKNELIASKLRGTIGLIK